MKFETVLDYKNFEDGIWYVESIPDGFSAGRLAERLEDLPRARFKYKFNKIKPDIYTALNQSELLSDIPSEVMSEVFDIVLTVVSKKMFDTRGVK